MVDIFQIYYDQTSERNCFDSCYKYDNSNYNLAGDKVVNLIEERESLPKNFQYFENRVIIDLYEKECFRNDYIGVFSHKFAQKHRIKSDQDFQNKVIKPVYTCNSHVYSFFKRNNQQNFLKHCVRWHPGAENILTRLIELLELPINIDTKLDNTIMYNHFIAKRDIYKYYVQNYLIPAINFMESDRQLKHLLWKDSRYRSRKLNKYPMHPFILERLFSIYCYIKGIKVNHIL